MFRTNSSAQDPENPSPRSHDLEEGGGHTGEGGTGWREEDGTDHSPKAGPLDEVRPGRRRDPRRWIRSRD